MDDDVLSDIIAKCNEQQSKVYDEPTKLQIVLLFVVFLIALFIISYFPYFK